MTAYYGLGCTYRDDGDVSENFFKTNRVCISSSNRNRVYFEGMFNDIKANDIVFLKSIIRGKKRFLRIKAIGIIDKDDNTFESDDYGHTKKVIWYPPYNPDGIDDDILLIPDGGVQRNTRIYREYNPKIIEQIDDLIKKYKK